MKISGWKWTKPPIDIVRMKNGSLITLDNTRVLVANESGNKTRAIVMQYDQKITNQKTRSRFETEKNGLPTTWGDAVKYRINKQNSGYIKSYPEGSSIIGLGNKK